MIWSYFNITVIAEWCTLPAAVLILNKKSGTWLFFIPLLVLTLCVETAGWYMIYILKQKNNSLPFNLLTVVTMFFFPWLLSQSELLLTIRKKIYAGLILFIVFSMVNLFFIQGLWNYNFYTETAGDLIMLVTCCLFFYNIMKEEKFRDLFRYEYFWLATGLLFTAFGSIVLYVFLNPLQEYYEKTHVNVYGYINYAVNLLLYTSIIIAFICRRRNTQL